MAQGNTPKIPKTKAQAREDRLKAALKANMGRRKAQNRARQTQVDEKEAPNGPNEESS
jgi:hypothetical protein